MMESLRGSVRYILKAPIDDTLSNYHCLPMDAIEGMRMFARLVSAGSPESRLASLKSASAPAF